MSLESSPAKGPPVFRVDGSRSHDLFGFAVWSHSEEEPIWSVSHATSKTSDQFPFEVTLGNLPATMVQSFPRRNAPPRILSEGETVVMQVSYKYRRRLLNDHGFGNEDFVFRVEPSGDLVAVPKPKDVRRVNMVVLKKFNE